MRFMTDPKFVETVSIVLGILFIAAVPVYFFRDRNFYFRVSWATMKSWLFAAPIMVLIFSLPDDWILVSLVFTSIAGAKVFFKLMGMFHRFLLVALTYLFIIAMGVCIYFDQQYLYNLMPMIALGLMCMVPVMTNSYKNMIQYLCLSLVSLIFLGWALLHLGWILNLPDGLYQITYLIILTEFFDNTVLATARHVGRVRIFDKIAGYRTLESTALSAVLTFMLAYLMRYLLPNSGEIYFLAAAAIAVLMGSLGDLTMSVFRKDMGVKITGAFILGRSDFLRRVDRLIFVAPAYYYVMQFLDRVLQ